MKFITFGEAGRCISLEIIAKGKENKWKFLSEPPLVDISKNLDGTYNLRVPEVAPDEEIVCLTKKRLQKKTNSWVLSNGVIEVLVISEIFDKPIVELFNTIGLDGQKEFIRTCEAVLKKAEESDQFELCSSISQYMLTEIKNNYKTKF